MGAVEKGLIIQEAIDTPIDFVMNGELTRFTIYGLNMPVLFTYIAIMMLISYIILLIRRIQCKTIDWTELGNIILELTIGVTIYRFTSIFLYILLGATLFVIFVEECPIFLLIGAMSICLPFMIPMIAWTIWLWYCRRKRYKMSLSKYSK